MGERRSQATELVLQERNLQESSNHTNVSSASGCDESFLFQTKSQPSTALPYFDITTRRRAQNQARLDRPNAEGDVGRRGIDCAKQPRAQIEGTQSLPSGCHVVSKALSNHHKCTHTHTHTQTHPFVASDQRFS